MLSWTIGNGFRVDNPAGDAIIGALPRVPRVVTHPVVLPPSEVAGVLAAVHESRAPASTKLAFVNLVLNAACSGEVRGATWDEMDLEADIWTVPAERMKSRREHRVPLSSRALGVLGKARDLADGNGLVFPSARGGPLSSSALPTLLHKLGIGATPHSTRASFRHWCADTGVRLEVAELCLGHSLPGGSNVNCRPDLLNDRRKVMEDWGAYVLPDGLLG